MVFLNFLKDFLFLFIRDGRQKQKQASRRAGSPEWDLIPGPGIMTLAGDRHWRY